jgi:uncharacterized protein
MNKEMIKKTIEPILRHHDVRKASFFGSIVRDEMTPSSDVDILIEFNDTSKKSLLDLIELRTELEESIRSRIDLVTFDSIHPSLKESILLNNESIYE